MVTYAEVLASNASINESTVPKVAVFAGGTSGIGKLAIKALVGVGSSLKIYIVGRRSSEERTRGFIQEMKAVNPKTELVWTEGEISLLAETTRVSKMIKSKESRIDLLFLTAGYSPWGTRRETSEGHEICQSLEYYSRMLFIQHLLPLLNRAEAGRVISVLGGGLETTWINTDDLDLKKGFGSLKAQPLYLTMNSMCMENFADENPSITFIHTWPGWVDTGSVWRTFDPNSLMGWFVWMTINPLIKLLTYSDDETGQRYLFQMTNAAYGGHGVAIVGKPGVNSRNQPANGLFLLNHRCDCTPNAKTMDTLRKDAKQKIWDHTQMILKPYL